MAAILAVVCLVVRWQLIDVLQAVSAALSLYTIFIYKRRMLQARLCLCGVAVVLVWYVLLAVFQGYATNIDALPMVNAILIFLARRGIIADERLVRAADRIR